MQSLIRKILISFFLLFCFGNAFSQGSYLKLKKIINTYNESNFSQTIIQGKTFLNKNPNYQGAELLTLYQMMITSYIAERNDANNNELNSKVDKLNVELKPLVNKFLNELNKEKMPNTWLSKASGWHKEGKKWDDWRNYNRPIYRKIINEIDEYNQNKNIGQTVNKNSSSKNQYLNKNEDKNYEVDLDFFKITEKTFDTELDSIYNNYVGIYTLLDGEESIKRKNILLKNSFLLYDNLVIKNYLIFKDNQELFLLELNDRNNNRSDHLSQIKKFADDKDKIQRFKNRFKTPAHNWVYSSFLRNKLESKGLYKIKRGKYEISKKWKTLLRKNFSKSNFKEVPGDFTNTKTKILYKGVEFFDLNKIDDDDLYIRSLIRENRDLLMDLSPVNYNFSNYDKRYIDLLKNIENYFSLLDDFNRVTFSSLYKNRINGLFSSQRKNINKIVFDKNTDNDVGFIKNSELFSSKYNPTFDRVIKLNSNGITISSGKNFSYSEANFKKERNTEGILALFNDYFLKNGNIYRFEQELLSLLNSENNFLKSNNDSFNVNKDQSSSNFINNKDLEKIEAFGTGTTYSEALDMALREAVEQSGAYMSSETRIEGDEMKMDKFNIISGSYVESYDVIDINESAADGFTVEISALISSSRSRDYIEVKENNEMVFDVGSFNSKINEQEENKKNEEIKILSLCENEFNRFIKESISFNLKSTDPVRNNKNKSKWDIDFTVTWSLNDNFDKFQNYFWKSLSEFALTEDDLKVYNKDNTDYFKFGNLYFRSQKSINTLVRFLTSINYYPSNFSLNIFGKKYFPEGISYDRSSGRRVQKRSDFKFLSSDINISGLVFLSANQTEKKLFNSHKVDRIYSNGAITNGYVPKNRYTKRFVANGKALYANTFLKNGKIDYRNVENVNLSSEFFIDETSISRSGTHRFSLTINQNQLKGYDPRFSDNNISNEVNYIYTPQKKSSTAQNNTQTNSSSTRASASSATSAKILGDNIWVRNSPTNGDVIMYLENNTQVKLLGYCCNETIRGKNNYWYKIDLEGKTGWVFGSQLRFLDEQYNKVKNPPKKDLKDWISPSLYKNLKSYWAFNGKTNALVGLPFVGSTYNSDYITDRFGNRTSAFNSNRYLTSNISSGNIGNEFTLSFWIYYTGNSGTIFTISESSEKYISINISNEKIQVKLTSPGNYWGNNIKIDGNSNIPSLRYNQWNHVVLGLSFGNSDSYETTYTINGSWRGGGIPGELKNIRNFNPRKIETLGYLSLRIDDLSLWNKFLSSSEAEFLYNFHKNTDLIKEAKTSF